MGAGARVRWACAGLLGGLGIVACGESGLFADASVGAAGPGAGNAGAGAAGGDVTVVGGASAAGGDATVGGRAGMGGATEGGGGQGGSGGDPWVPPTCDPPCDNVFSFCCDKGDGNATCVNSTQGCKCDRAQEGLSCGGFFGECCAAPGSDIGVCKSSSVGCACTPGANQCGVLNPCCDKGSGFECSTSASECLCGDDARICDFVYDVCCDKGNGKRCYQNEGGCL